MSIGITGIAIGRDVFINIKSSVNTGFGLETEYSLLIKHLKQVFEEDYSQRLIDENIFRLRSHRLGLIRLSRSRGGGWWSGGYNEIIYSSMSRKKYKKLIMEFC